MYRALSSRSVKPPPSPSLTHTLPHSPFFPPAPLRYVVGQYPRFLRAHWKFLKTVINKLFEFMHETHPGVQDMACDTFLKISTKCKRKFVIQQVGEAEPFVAELLRNLNDTIKLLEPHQVHSFYESVGHMLSAETDPQKREEYLQRLMEPPNSIWRSILQQARGVCSHPLPAAAPGSLRCRRRVGVWGVFPRRCGSA